MGGFPPIIVLDVSLTLCACVTLFSKTLSINYFPALGRQALAYLLLPPLQHIHYIVKRKPFGLQQYQEVKQ